MSLKGIRLEELKEVLDILEAAFNELDVDMDQVIKERGKQKT